MKKTLIIIFIVMLLTACSQSTSGRSYAMIVVVNNIEYNGTEENVSDYKIEKTIGTIIGQVDAGQFPSNNQSNFFEKGSVIYSVKNETDFIIIEDTKGDLFLLQKSPGPYIISA
ncbi:membrane lipoprotein lipid attachment site-containing protein [Bacillus sp. J33]|uniref:membrane lipoprotein lipid attachment site-containing protein n=1 Tax=Bacillus sp. J33 TaxID=935836 RepID=UPI00047AFF60|nr:membrane lipoprotein lipid attachment site-containing protein [Bacillus sp. J33]